MTIFVKLTIGGTTYTTQKEINIDRSIGDYNSSSSFEIVFDNIRGIYNDEFSLNQEVIIYADNDINPPTTKIFTGVIENIEYQGEEQDEKIILIGRDYSASLQDITVQPTIFISRDAGTIAKAIVISNAGGVVTTNNIDTSTGTTIEKIAFNHKSIFDALQQLAEISGFYFYVDVNKDVHFEVKAGTSSGITLNNTNVIGARFRNDDSDLFNKIWVYGDRVLTGNTDAFTADGAGSVYTLSDKPHNTRVTAAGSLVEFGGVFEMDNPHFKSGLKWVVDFDNRYVIFVSGTAAGDNIQASGIAISIDFERSTPILSFKTDATSISTYGTKVKVITERNAKSYAHAESIATSYLAEHKDPRIQGDATIYGLLNLIPGNTIIVNLPNHNISSQTYTILNVSYKLNPQNILNGTIMEVSLNKKISDFTDVMKDQMMRLKTVETGNLDGMLSRLETATNDITTQVHYEIYTRGIGSAFIFHSNTNDKFNSPAALLGEVRGVLTFNQSGGDF